MREEEIIALVGFGALGAVFIGRAIYQWRKDQETHARWVDFAGENRFTVSGSYPTVELRGVYSGWPVAIVFWTERRGSGKNRRTVRLARVTVEAPVPLGDLSVADETLFSWLGGLIMGQDIQTGDDVFDRRYNIAGGEPDFARGLLGPAARAAFLEADGRDPQIEIARGALQWRGEPGRIEDPRLGGALRIMDVLIGVGATLGT